MSWRAKYSCLFLTSLFALGLVAGCKERAVAQRKVRDKMARLSTPSASTHRPRLPPGPALRPARLAGSWYPKDAAALRAQLDGFVAAAAKVKETAPAGQPLGVVAPHAGLRFSGRTAASVYRLVGAAKPNRVFVLGPSHYERLRGVAVVDGKRFATPLGALRIDKVARGKLLLHPLFLRSPQADAKEHSVELQMPFLRYVASQAHVVPLIVGQLTLHEVRRVADAIRALLVPGDLVVASSDFTHYGPRFRYLPFKGKAALAKNLPASLEALDRRAFARLEAGDLPAFWRFKHETNDTICGFYPVSILRAILGPKVRGKLLHYDTSGRAEKKYENSVSYLAIAFADARGWAATRGEHTAEFLSPHEARQVVKIARRTLEAHFEAQRLGKSTAGTPRVFDPKVAKLVGKGRLEQRHGVFVTLKRADGRLRGCIGHVIGRMPLYRGIVENALNAALRDPRFSPLRSEELAKLSIEVTVLTPPRHVSGPKAITIGRDGVILRKGDKRALFLPQVAVEQGWGLERTLRALGRKAGLGADGWRTARYQVFQGYVYEEQGGAS